MNSSMKTLTSCIIFFSLLAVCLSPALAQRTKVQSVQDNSRSRLRMAQDYERRGNYNTALRIYKRLYTEVPANQLYYEGLKRNMVRMKQFDELIEMINVRISRTNGVRPNVDLADVYYRKGESERALAIWQQALTQFAQQKSTYTYVANAMVSNRLYDEALEAYRQGRQTFNDENVFIFEMANIYVLRLQYKEATLEYLKHLERNPNQFGYIENRIVNYTKDPERAREVAAILEENLAGRKQKYLVRKLLADLNLRIEAYGPALIQFKILETMEPPNPNQRKIAGNGRELFFFANKALKAGEFRYAQEAFNLILHNYPKSSYKVQALYGLAVAKQKQGASTEALQQFEELVKAGRTSPWAQEALYQIGEIYFSDLFEIDQALDAYNRIIRSYPAGKKTDQAYFRVGDCYAIKGDFEKAKTWYQRASTLLGPNSPLQDRAFFKTAHLQFLAGDYEAAKEALAKITEKIGQDGVSQDYVNDALELTFLIEENEGKSEEALRAYSAAQQLKMQKKDAEAIAALNRIVAIYPAADVVNESLMELGELEKERGNFEVAVGHFETLLAEHSESVYNALAQKHIAEIYETGLDDLQKAYEAYENVLINYPNSLYLEEVRLKLRELQGRRLNN